MVAAAALVGATVSGLSGFAFGLVVLGLWLHVLPPVIAGPMVVICSLVVQVMSLGTLRHALRWERLLPFLIAGLAGVPLGIWLLTRVDPVLFRRGVGAFLMLYALYQLAGPRRALAWGGKALDAAIGFIGGVMGGLAGLSGAVPTAWVMLRGWSKDEARAVYQPFNFSIQVVALVVMLGAGTLGRAHAYYAVICLPGLVVGGALGLWLYRRVNEVWFRRIVLWLLLASGMALVV
ncbi:MAG: sulfite exporter TauE/SafE family protein [Rhodospirillales bacterium]